MKAISKCSTLVFLVPLVLYTVDARSANAGEAIRAFAWNKVTVDTNYVYSPVRVNPWVSVSDVAAETLALPEGARMIILTHFDSVGHLIDHEEDKCIDPITGSSTEFRCPWFDHGITAVRSSVTGFVKNFVDAGGKVDYLELDYEANLSQWSIPYEKLQDHVNAIANDSRYKPGDHVYERMQPYDIRAVPTNKAAAIRFNAVMAEMKNKAIDEAEIYVFKSYFPAITGANFNSNLTKEDEVQPDLNGHLQYSFSHAGTHNNVALYGMIGQLQNTTPLGASAPVGNTPFSVLRWELRVARAIKNSSTDQLRPWVGFKSWIKDFVPVAFGNSPYYDELIYHLALTGVDDFLYFNPKSTTGEVSPGTRSTDVDDKHLDNILRKLAEIGVRKSDRPILLTTIPWDSNIIVSGSKAVDGQRVYRVTLPPEYNAAIVKLDGTSIKTLRLQEGEAGVWFDTREIGDVTFVPTKVMVAPYLKLSSDYTSYRHKVTFLECLKVQFE